MKRPSFSSAHARSALGLSAILLAGSLSLVADTQATSPQQGSAPRAVNFTSAQQLEQLRVRQTYAHPAWKTLSWSERARRTAVFAKRVINRTAAKVFATAADPAPVAAGFQGNFTVISQGDSDGIVLQRQSDCSLTLLGGSYTISLTSPTFSITSQTPAFERVLHDAAGLTTDAGAFSNGCDDPSSGIGSRRGAYLGRSAQNNYLFAGAGYNSSTDTNALHYGAVAASTQTIGSFGNDYSLPGIDGIAAGDLDGDGLADVVGVDTYESASIVVWLTHADGTVSSPTPYALSGVGDRTSAAVTTDVNGDGKLDVVVATRNTQSNPNPEYLSVLFGRGDGTLGAPTSVSIPTPTTAPGTFGATQIVNLIAADLRGTGHPDLIGSNGLVLLNHNGDGTFTVGDFAFPPLSASSSWGPNLVAADFNKDSDLDLAVSNGLNVAIWTGTGDGHFTVGKAYSTIDNVGYLTASDLDGDGNIDLYVGLANGGFFGGDQFEIGQAYALMGNGDGSFQGAPSTPFVYTGTNLADLNGDGEVDGVGVNSDLSLTAYLGDGSGGFTAAGTVPTSPITLFGRQYSTHDIDSIGLADVNGDGKTDLLFILRDLYVRPPVGFDTPGVIIALGDGQGGFGTPAFFGSGHFVPTVDGDADQHIANLRLFDTNHDGKIDIAFDYVSRDFTTNTYYAGVAVHQGSGDGTFQAPGTVELYSGAASVDTEKFHVAKVADLNGDANPELLVLARSTRLNSNLSQYEYDLQIAINNGDGTFDTPETLDIGDVVLNGLLYGTQYASIDVADMNDDGSQDLVLQGGASTGNMRLAIALGNGDATFAAPVSTTFSASFAHQGIAVADFNGDDKLDVAVGSVFGAPGSGITFGNGDGTLQPASVSGSGLQPNELIYLNVGGAALARDFNGDGKVDFLSGSTLLLSAGTSTSPPDFRPSASSLAGTASAGGTVETTLTFSASGGFSGDVTLSCSGLPAGASCSFNPSTVTVGSSAVTSTLTIATTARTAQAMGPLGHPWNPGMPEGTLLAGAAVPFLVRGRSRKRANAALRVGLLLLAGVFLYACGGGGSGDDGGSTPPPSSGTPAGDYSITINATNGSTTHTLTYVLTVS